MSLLDLGRPSVAAAESTRPYRDRPPVPVSGPFAGPMNSMTGQLVPTLPEIRRAAPEVELKGLLPRFKDRLVREVLPTLATQQGQMTYGANVLKLAGEVATGDPDMTTRLVRQHTADAMDVALLATPMFEIPGALKFGEAVFKQTERQIVKAIGRALANRDFDTAGRLAVNLQRSANNIPSRAAAGAYMGLQAGANAAAFASTDALIRGEDVVSAASRGFGGGFGFGALLGAGVGAAITSKGNRPTTIADLGGGRVPAYDVPKHGEVGSDLVAGYRLDRSHGSPERPVEYFFVPLEQIGAPPRHHTMSWVPQAQPYISFSYQGREQGVHAYYVPYFTTGRPRKPTDIGEGSSFGGDETLTARAGATLMNKLWQELVNRHPNQEIRIYAEPAARVTEKLFRGQKSTARLARLGMEQGEDAHGEFIRILPQKPRVARPSMEPEANRLMEGEVPYQYERPAEGVGLSEGFLGGGRPNTFTDYVADWYNRRRAASWEGRDPGSVQLSEMLPRASGNVSIVEEPAAGGARQLAFRQMEPARVPGQPENVTAEEVQRQLLMADVSPMRAKPEASAGLESIDTYLYREAGRRGRARADESQTVMQRAAMNRQARRQLELGAEEIPQAAQRVVDAIGDDLHSFTPSHVMMSRVPANWRENLREYENLGLRGHSNVIVRDMFSETEAAALAWSASQRIPTSGRGVARQFWIDTRTPTAILRRTAEDIASAWRANRDSEQINRLVRGEMATAIEEGISSRMGMGRMTGHADAEQLAMDVMQRLSALPARDMNLGLYSALREAGIETADYDGLFDALLSSGPASVGQLLGHGP